MPGRFGSSVTPRRLRRPVSSVTPRRLRRPAIAGALAGVASLALAAASLSAAESFGPMPKPVESRCAQLTISRHLVNIGQTIEASAGPATASCGGPSATVHWAWPINSPDNNEIEGLTETHTCRGTTSQCQFKAILYTQPGLWQGFCITGVSPQGAWSSCQSYAVRTGQYHVLTGTIFNLPHNTPVKVTVTGHGARHTVTTDVAGVWRLAVTKGTYTISFRGRRKTIRHKVTVRGKPGTGTTVNLTA
jgi:hypothetical protein